MKVLPRMNVYAVALIATMAFLLGPALAEPDAPPKTSSEAYQIKVINETGTDILVRAVSFNRNWDAPVVKKGESFTASDERNYFRKGDKVFVAYDLVTHHVIASKVVTITGPTVVTFTAAKEIVSGPLASK